MEFRKKVTITLYARQQKRHRCIEQSFGLCGRGRGWVFPVLSEWAFSAGLISVLSAFGAASLCCCRTTQGFHGSRNDFKVQLTDYISQFLNYLLAPATLSWHLSIWFLWAEVSFSSLSFWLWHSFQPMSLYELSFLKNSPRFSPKGTFQSTLVTY